MKRVVRGFLLFILTLSTSVVVGQSVSWSTSFGGDGNTEWANDVLIENDRILICGVSNSANGDFDGGVGEDMWLMRCDTSGQLLSTRRLGGSANEGGKAISAVSDGGYIVTGISFSTDGDATGANYHGGGDVWVVKLDAELNIEWQQMYGGSNRDDPQAIMETSDGHFLVTANTTSSDGDVEGFHIGSPIWNDAWILKLDAMGNIVWQRCVGGTDDEAAWSVVETPEGYVFAGHSRSADGDLSANFGDRDVLVASLSKVTGDIQWVGNYGGSEMDTGLDLLYTQRQTLVVAGHANSGDVDLDSNNGLSDFWFLELDYQGDIRVSAAYGSGGGDVAHAVQELDANTYLLAGRAGTGDGPGGDLSNLYGNTDAWVVVVDSLGTLLSEHNYGGSEQDIFYGAKLDASGALYAVGQTRSDDYDLNENAGGNDWFVASLSFAELVTVSVSDVSEWESGLRIFPNPTRGHLQVELSDPDIRLLRLFDPSGREVQVLRPGANWLDVPAGLYFVQVIYQGPRPQRYVKVVVEE